MKGMESMSMTAVSSVMQACWVASISLWKRDQKSRRQKPVLHHSNTLGTLSSGQGKNKVDVRRRYKSLRGCVSETEILERFVFPSRNRWDWV